MVALILTVFLMLHIKTSWQSNLINSYYPYTYWLTQDTNLIHSYFTVHSCTNDPFWDVSKNETKFYKNLCSTSVFYSIIIFIDRMTYIRLFHYKSDAEEKKTCLFFFRVKPCTRGYKKCYMRYSHRYLLRGHIGVAYGSCHKIQPNISLVHS